MPPGEPFAPTEPEWLIRSQAGLPPIKKTSELPRIIPPLPTGDTKDLKVWREYWKQHDAQVAKAAREQFAELIEDKLPRYPSDLGDMYLLSDIQELAQQQRRRKGDDTGL